MIRVSIDARQLIRYQDKISRAPAAVRRAAAKSINAAGRRMVDEMAIALARETGLPLDTTTNLYTVEEATPENLRFRVRASRSLVQPTSNRPIQPHQPQRPDEFFRPGELVRVVTAGDDRVCEKCEELAANSPYTIEEARAAIPHHPNAVLAGSTFASYGAVRELVRARYNGPCISLWAGPKFVSIGPNHPMMTRRGLVRASELTERDELLYDLRHDFPLLNGPSVGASNEPYLEQMPFVEDAFHAVRPLGGGMFVVPSSADLHGDAVFCQGEVEVIMPTRQLLPVLDPCGVQHLRKRNFVFADMGAQMEARRSASDLGFDAVDLSTSCSVCGPNSRVLADGIFSWLPISELAHGWFSGLAFDASVAHSLYCSNGFVVSNCRCKVMPYGQRRMQMQVQRDNQTMQERISLRRLAQESIEATRIELRVT